MKKAFILITLAAFITCGITSCQKDGVYKPKGKINKIFNETSYSSKYLMELWTWDGNKLDKIEHLDENWIENFTYDGNKLVRIDDYKYQEYAEFKYDGNKLSKVAYYYHGQLIYEGNLIYDGNELSELKLKWNDYDAKSLTNQHLNPFGQIMPKEIATKMLKSIEKKSSQHKGSFRTYTFEFDWEGNNISEIELFGQGGYQLEYEFAYDDKINPYQGYLGLHSYKTHLNVANTRSANNIVIIIERESAGSTTETTVNEFIYKYDGKLPVEQRLVTHGYYTVKSFEYE